MSLIRELLSLPSIRNLFRPLAGAFISGLVLLGQVNLIATGTPQTHHGVATFIDPLEPIPNGAVRLFEEKTELRDQTDAPGPCDLSIAPGFWKRTAHTESDASPEREALTDANTDTKMAPELKAGARLVSEDVFDGGGNGLPAVVDGSPLEKTEEGASGHYLSTGTTQKARISPPEIQPAGQVSVAKILLYDLEIIGPDPPVASNQSPVIFQCVAHDTSGRKLEVSPQWHMEPPGAGTTSYSRDGGIITFVPHEDFIGQVQVFLTDSISGQTAQFNASNCLAECDRGLAVFHCLSGDAPEISVGDRQGFRLIIPQGAIPPGDTSLIFLRKPTVLEIKRTTPHHHLWGQIYDVRTIDAISEISFSAGDYISFIRPLELILPLISEARSSKTAVGRWSYQDLEWTSLGGTASGEEISVSVDHLSQFAVLSASTSLGLNDIRLVPNPFTPHDPYGLQLAFTLSSDRARKPFVTIRVYNMAGQLVRTICENEPLPKGSYLPGKSFLDSRGRDITLWDGRTETGELARNGRYLIHFRADDSAGTVEKLVTAVLIK